MIFNRHTDESLKFHRGKESLETGEFDSSFEKTIKILGIPVLKQSYRRNVETDSSRGGVGFSKK
jgi:hypothetical protein